jgi:hypothetical protein
MILVLGDRRDACVALAYERLCARGTLALLVEDGDLFTSAGMSSLSSGPFLDGFLEIDRRRVSLGKLSGVLVRIPAPTVPRREMSREDHEYATMEAHAAMVALLSGLTCPVVNRPIPGTTDRPVFANREALRQVASFGFEFPPTLSTSSEREALRFYDRCGQRAAVAPASSTTCWSQVRGADGRRRLQEAVAQGPIAIQEVPPGMTLQVLAIGGRAIGALRLLDHDPDDGAVLFEPTPVASTERERCCRLAHSLGLSFAGIRLVRGDDGRLYCADVSARPTYDDCHAEIQALATTALVELLEAPDGHR